MENMNDGDESLMWYHGQLSKEKSEEILVKGKKKSNESIKQGTQTLVFDFLRV